MAQTKVRFDRAVEGATNIVDSGTEGTKVASGTTGQRGSTTGQWRYNTTTGFFEGRNASGDFSTLEPAPTVTSVDITEVDSAAGGNQTIVITGTNFTSGATASFIGSTASFNAATTTIDSVTQITAVAPKASFLNAQEPYKVKVTSASGVAGTSSVGLINVDSAPTWTTSAGSLGSINDNATGNHFTITASDSDGDTISYSETGATNITGAGLSLNSSTGVISGDPTNVGSSTTVSFTGRATAGSKTVDRSFSFIVTPTPDGSSQALAATNPAALSALGINTDGTYWLDPDGTGGGQFYVKFGIGGGSGYAMALAMRWANPLFFGQLMFNKWDGHTGNANGPAISDNSTWNGTAATTIPNSAAHIMLAWHDDISSATPTDYVHAAVVGSTSSNTGFFATSSSENSAYTPSSVTAFSVSGFSDTSSPQWHFHTHDGTNDGMPRGFSRSGLGHSSNVDGTDHLLGAIGDGCGSFTSASGVASINSNSETYVGDRKNIGGGNGAGGTYCVSIPSNNNDGWTMWWR